MINMEILSPIIPDELRNMVSIEYSKIAEFHWLNIVSEKNDSLISDRVFTGFDKNINIAFSKAVSEMIERKSFSLGHKENLISCNTLRSDGFAAFPVTGNLSLAKKQARENALNEAIERYAWATWWDENQIKYKYEKYFTQDFCNKFSYLKNLLNELSNKLNFTFIHLVEPKISSLEKKLLIVVAEFQDGVVTGGACGDTEKTESILIRAFSELLRHALVLVQKKEKPSNLSDYERRLLYFASETGKNKFYNRLSSKGSNNINLPELAIDEQIPSEKTHYVHRCLFKNQPPFIDEDSERMCL